ncbi:MAG: pyridoxal phosphate-dependent aminotransferase [Bryobacteraceae bacterium]|jgi:aspartate aminotransferase
MSVARRIVADIERASWIRRMFEEGLHLKAERGADKIFDFTLGNPEVEPPEPVLETLRRVVAENRAHSHGYMPNAGFPAVRAAIARRLEKRTGLPYTAEHILMTCGAAGACNVLLKSVLNPGDEVIVLAPFFPEYRFYIENHGGRVVPVETTAEFQLDIGRIAAALTPRTRAILLNSPNNPSGAVYPAEALAELNAMLGRHPDVIVVSDEPYRTLVFDGRTAPETAAIIERCAIADSWSKAAALAGERIGYLALSPRIAEWAALRDAATFASRVLGFINASAIWQLVMSEAPEATIDVAAYQAKRDLVCGALAGMGYELTRPAGTFYVFPKTPIADDVAFIRLLQREGVLAVPGSGFSRPGHFRLSLTVPRDAIERSLPAFERALAAARAASPTG